MTKEELSVIVKGMVEELLGTVSNDMLQNIETTVTKQFENISKDFVRKPVGGDSGEDQSKFKTFGDQLVAVSKAYQGHGVDARLKAASGSNEAIPSEGGFLVQSDFAQGLIMNAHDSAVLYPKCKKLPISANSNSMTLYGVDETSRANGSRWGGIQVYWADEAATVTATKPKWRVMNLKLKKLMGLSYVTDELLADAAALQAWITQAFTEEISFKIDDGILRGSGAGQLLGILNSAALISQAAESGQPASTVEYANIINMWNRIPARNRARAEWYINQDVEPQLDQMYLAVGTGGVPVYMPAGGVTGASFSTLKGRPVVPVEQCSALGTIGDILLMDLGEYLTIDKSAPTADSSIHVRFLYDEMTFRFTYRIDGQPLWHSNLTSYQSGTTRSPFVGLASRT